MFDFRHFRVDRISRFCAEPSSINAEKRSELARHLSTHCRRCWAAVDDVAPASVAHSRDPVAEALYHLSTPQSRAPLTADHRATVEDVRRRPFGFAFLLVEEARLLSWHGKTPAPLEDDVFLIIGTLRPRRRQRQHHDDLYAVAMAYLSLVRTSRGELDAARMAWFMAERHRQDGTGDARVRATVLEAHASLAAALGDAWRAESFLDAALEELAGDPKHAPRWSELYGIKAATGRTMETARAAWREHRLPKVEDPARSPVVREVWP